MQVSPSYGSAWEKLADNIHRVRHVKCDELKPACSRCTKSGRQCDGYALDGRRPAQDPIQIVHWQPNSLALRRMSVDIAGNKEERRAFHFFRHNSAPDLPGFFESGFWSQLVLQASHAEPSVRHAVIALGSMHETMQHEDLELSKTGKACNPFALQQCNKAIGHLNQYLCSNQQHSNEMLLISCAIFICFESLQGNYESALSHLSSGLAIFRRWQTQNAKTLQSGTAASSEPQQGVDSEVIQMFSRLNMQALLFPDTHLFPTEFIMQEVGVVVDSVPESFGNLSEARNSLDDCMGYLLQALSAAYFQSQGSDEQSSKDTPPVPINMNLLPQWLAVFDTFLQNAGPNLVPKELQRATLLEIQYRCANILVTVGMPPKEAAFDEFQKDFESIVSLAESIIHGGGTIKDPKRTRDFSFDMSIVAPLYFTATRCREPLIRRQALSLLWTTARQECIWNAEMLTKIAERIILIEEGRENVGLGPGSRSDTVTSRLLVFNATIYSEQRRVLVECCQELCDASEEVSLRDEWVTY